MTEKQKPASGEAGGPDKDKPLNHYPYCSTDVLIVNTGRLIMRAAFALVDLGREPI